MTPTAEDYASALLLSYCAIQWPGYRIGAHHRRIADALQRSESGLCPRLIITMPPRHGKSMLASEYFPAWYLGRNPSHSVIAATYSQDLADDFGRRVRAQIADPLFGAVFPGAKVADDSSSVKRLHVESSQSDGQRGAYYAVGAGGPLTGRGAHLLLIDDPIKGREDADSELSRRRLRDWYTSTAYTRLMPGARIVLIQCMTGDTPVLMASGAERELRDVRPGDRVATYKDGAVSESTVTNWANQGPDSVFEIRMQSGIIVRANARHPFLAERDGVMQWLRTDQLRPGTTILKAIGESGAGLCALPMTARNLLSARVCALPTTVKAAGAMVFARLRRTLIHGVRHICDIAMASTWQSTRPSWQIKAVCAQFAGNRRAVQTRGRIGAGSSASIIATIASAFAGSCATTAILRSGTAKPNPSCAQPLSTYAITRDSVVEVVAAGTEDVFDLQIAGTENFIAGGLVSHNTRWHEDDLAGWLLREHAHEGWELLSLPALDDAGAALWPDQYPADTLARIRSSIGDRDWQALYQQSPTNDSGGYFKREWLREWKKLPAFLTYYGTSDYAVTADGGDYTVHRVWGVDPSGGLYRVDGWRGQTASDEWIERKIDLMAKHKPAAWFGEGGVIQKAVQPMLTRRMRERGVYCRMEWLPSIADKPTRCRGFQARASMGSVWFEPGAEIDEFVRFPAGRHDDEVDTAGMIGRALDDAHPAIASVLPTFRPKIDRWARAFGDHEEVRSWRTA